MSNFDEYEVIGRHFSDVTDLGDRYLFSGFRGALNEARTATGRNPLGERTGPVQAIWLGSLCYMVLLDQIGTCFKIKNKVDRVLVPDNMSGFKKALYRFSDLTDEEIEALYALRCSFAHDFSLIHWDSRKKKYTYRFLVGSGSSGDMIALPVIPWDGDFDNRIPENQTVINLELFGDFVENICRKLEESHSTGELDVILPRRHEELLKRYSFSSLKKESA